MIRRFSLTGLLGAFLTGCVAASVNNPMLQGAEVGVFPAVTAADLEGREYALPRDLPAVPTILLLGFAHEQRAAVSRWRALLERDLTLQPRPPIFEVPVIDNKSAPLRTIIRNGMRAALDDAGRHHTLTLFLERAEFLKVLELEAGFPAVIALTPSGRIVWQYAGSPDPAVVPQLQVALANESRR